MQIPPGFDPFNAGGAPGPIGPGAPGAPGGPPGPIGPQLPQGPGLTGFESLDSFPQFKDAGLNRSVVADEFRSITNRKKMNDAMERAKEIRQDLRQVNQSFRDKILEIHKAYVGDFTEMQKYRGRAKIVIPSVFENVRNTAPRIMRALFSPSPFIRIELDPTEQAGTYSLQQDQELLMTQARQMQFYWKFGRAVEQCLIYGITLVKTPWRYETRSVRRRVFDPLSIITDPSRVESIEEVIYDNPDFIVPNLLRVDFDPTAETPEDTPIFEDYDVTWSELKLMEKQGLLRNVDEIKEQPGIGITDIDEQAELQDYYESLNVEELLSTPALRKHHRKITDAWIPFDINGDGIDEIVNIVYANDQVPLKLLENPYWTAQKPWMFCQLTPILHATKGMGMVEPVLKPQYMLNDIANQLMDNVTQILCNMWKTSHSNKLKSNLLKFSPFKILSLNNPEKLVPIEQRDVTHVGIRMISMVQDIIQRVVGSPSLLAGMPTHTQLDKTKGAVQAAISEANVRIEFMIKNMAENLVEPFFERMWQYNQQFIVEDRRVNIGGQEAVISPQDITGKRKVKAEGVFDMSTREQKEQKLEQLAGMLMQVPPEIADIDKVALLQRVWNASEGLGPAEAVIRPPQPPAPQPAQPGGGPPQPGGAPSAPGGQQGPEQLLAALQQAQGGQ